MSVGALNTQNNAILDLLGPNTVGSDLLSSATRPEQTRQERDGGFDQTLRETSAKRPGRETSAVDQSDAKERTGDDASREAGVGDEVSADRGDKPGAEASDQQSDSTQQRGEQAEAKPQDGEGDTQQGEVVEGEALAGAQKQSTQAGLLNVALQAGQDGQAASNPGEADAEAAALQSRQQAQAVLSQANAQSAQRAQAQQGATQVQAVNVAAVQTQQAGSEADTGGDEARGESTSNAQVAATTRSAGNATAATTAFTVSDASASEARLPINPTGNTQQAEAAKALQAQPMAANSDSDAVNTSRITRGLANAVQQRGGAVTLRLTPPEMGTVRIQMQINGGNVSASFHAESASAQTMLTQQLSQLRAALETQGMNVERLTVQPMASTAQSQNASQNQNDSNQQQNQGQQQSANDGRSRGQYSGDSSGGRRDGDTGAQQQQQTPRGFFDQFTEAGDAEAA